MKANKPREAGCQCELEACHPLEGVSSQLLRHSLSYMQAQKEYCFCPFINVTTQACQSKKTCQSTNYLKECPGEHIHRLSLVCFVYCRLRLLLGFR